VALLTSCHVLNTVLMKIKEKTPYEKWIKRKSSLSYLRTWGCLDKVNVPINKKRKLTPKIVNCVFLGYAHNSTGYRFLVIKSDIPYVHIDTFLESRDVTFFENIFPMKKSYGMSSLPANVLADTSPEPLKIFSMLNIHLNQSMRKLIVKLLGGARAQGLQSISVMILLFVSWMTLLKPLSRHLHLLMRMIEKKRSVVRWTQFSPMELGS
jgi:hypothetical protein